MSWRNHIKIHPAAEMFPLLADGELFALGEDIRRNGLSNPIVFTVKNDEPILVDGRNRLDAAERAGLRVKLITKSQKKHWWNFEIFDGDGEQVDLDPHGAGFASAVRVISEPVPYIISANIHRRHLTLMQKKELVAALIKEQPERSNRATAALVKVDHKTVGAVRKEMEGRGEIPHVDRTIDTKGRSQPAAKPKPAPNQSSISKLTGKERVAILAAGVASCMGVPNPSAIDDVIPPREACLMAVREMILDEWLPQIPPDQFEQFIAELHYEINDLDRVIRKKALQVKALN